uniref:Doubled CXXCH domain-containing protein n=1 Tax=Candidatus Kentrum sp. DK TaxID=2126562 RepID=A0A450S3Z1_9GAMM|nr:MAG: doubled CXXCH domain-containing protein [Candidatus Kentron sp. DK]
MRMRIRVPVCLLALFVVAVARVFASGPAPSADSPAPPGSRPVEAPAKTLQVSNCRICHQNPGMRPAFVGDDGLRHDLYVDQQRFEWSTHYIMAGTYYCTDCHPTGYQVYPHRERKPMGCIDCHDDALLKEKFLAIRASFQQSVHYDAEQVQFQCSSCHPAHYMRKGQRMTLREKNAMCIDCHGERYNPGGLTLLEQHQWHPRAQLHLERTACIACHTQPGEWEDPVTFKHRVLPKEQASRVCDDCHSPNGKLADYLIDIGENPLQLSNEQLADKFYVSGATRSYWLDTLGLGLLAAVAIGMFGHGLLRAVVTLLGRKQ